MTEKLQGTITACATKHGTAACDAKLPYSGIKLLDAFIPKHPSSVLLTTDIIYYSWPRNVFSDEYVACEAV